MSEWWTYSLSSFLLFSARTYYRLFELYNADVWPLQIVALALGLAILVLIWRGAAWSGRAVAAILVGALAVRRLGVSAGALRHHQLGGALFRHRLRAAGGAARRGPASCATGFASASAIVAAKVGLALLIYALAIHPLIAPLTGRPWTQAEIFGLAPDPTAIATLGVLLAADRPRWHLLVLPLLWCATSGLTLWTHGIARGAGRSRAGSPCGGARRMESAGASGKNTVATTLWRWLIAS